MSFFGRLGGSMPYVKWNELNEDWILDTVKKLSEDWARYHADWEAWKNNTDQAFQDLHDYVMDYFANLDVSEEISEKLNQMAADGSLSALIQPLFDEYKAQINPILTDINQEIAVLSSRMDEFTNLPDGSTSGDAELQDIRVAFNGTVYPTAGDAVRKQVEYLFNYGLIGTNITINDNNKGEICSGDCNNLPINKIYGVAGGVVLSNSPFTSYYTIMTLGKWKGSTAGDFQLATRASDGKTKIRTLYNSTYGWSQWVELATNTDVTNLQNEILSNFNKSVYGTNITITNNNKEEICNSTADNIPNNRIYGIGGDTSIINRPFSSGYCLIITLGKYTDRTAGDVQIAIDTYRGDITYRNYINVGGGWTPWKTIQKLITNEALYSGIEMFERFGVIGDSFASGDIVTPTGQVEKYELSWGQMLARRSGSTCVNYSRGGYGTYKFLDPSDPQYNTYCMGKVLSDISSGNPCGLYFLCMGINDSSKDRTFGDKTGGLEYLGTSADINQSDYTLNANSFWGNYGKIIAQIQEATPKSRIVMVTFCRKKFGVYIESYDAYIQAIQEIAAYFNIPCITLTDDEYFNSDYYMELMSSYHPTAPQYVGMSKGIERLLSRAIVNKYSYFKDYTGI